MKAHDALLGTHSDSGGNYDNHKIYDKQWRSVEISIILLIREAKTLDPFLRKLLGRRSVKFGTVIHYKEE